VQGKVKWFSEEKGYGYIVAEDGKEHYFNIRDIQGTNLPRNGNAVNFDSRQGAKGPRASSVVVDPNSQASTGSRNTDERVTCNHCGKKMMPRLIIRNGSPDHSVCPFCAGVYKNFSQCFIATAVYGDYYAPEVIALRRFRDEILQPYSAGRIFIATYYRVSPPIAQFISQKPLLAAAIKPLLNALARRNG
jgi:cold shock CspA family protein